MGGLRPDAHGTVGGLGSLVHSDNRPAALRAWVYVATYRSAAALACWSFPSLHVDVLFVIDNSVEEDIADFELSDAHQRLTAAAPPFLASLHETLPGSSLHIGVSTGDAYSFNEDSGEGCETLPGLVQSTAFGGLWTVHLGTQLHVGGR